MRPAAHELISTATACQGSRLPGGAVASVARPPALTISMDQLAVASVVTWY